MQYDSLVNMQKKKCIWGNSSEVISNTPKLKFTVVGEVYLLLKLAWLMLGFDVDTYNVSHFLASQQALTALGCIYPGGSKIKMKWFSFSRWYAVSFIESSFQSIILWKMRKETRQSFSLSLSHTHIHS